MSKGITIDSYLNREIKLQDFLDALSKDPELQAASWSLIRYDKSVPWWLNNVRRYYDATHNETDCSQILCELVDEYSLFWDPIAYKELPLLHQFLVLYHLEVIQTPFVLFQEYERDRKIGEEVRKQWSLAKSSASMVYEDSRLDLLYSDSQDDFVSDFNSGLTLIQQITGGSFDTLIQNLFMPFGVAPHIPSPSYHVDYLFSSNYNIKSIMKAVEECCGFTVEKETSHGHLEYDSSVYKLVPLLIELACTESEFWESPDWPKLWYCIVNPNSLLIRDIDIVIILYFIRDLIILWFKLSPEYHDMTVFSFFKESPETIFQLSGEYRWEFPMEEVFPETVVSRKKPKRHRDLLDFITRLYCGHKLLSDQERKYLVSVKDFIPNLFEKEELYAFLQASPEILQILTGLTSIRREPFDIIYHMYQNLCTLGNKWDSKGIPNNRVTLKFLGRNPFYHVSLFELMRVMYTRALSFIPFLQAERDVLKEHSVKESWGNPGDPTVDHLIEVSDPLGSHFIDSLYLTCILHNQGRGTRDSFLVDFVINHYIEYFGPSNSGEISEQAKISVRNVLEQWARKELFYTLECETRKYE